MRAGGGIESTGAAAVNTLANTNLDMNGTAANPGNGGGMHVTDAGTTNITGGTVNNNTASNEGGGLWNDDGTMTIDGTTINNNTASGPAADNGGGGLFNDGGTLTISNATIDSNVADGAAGSGGGIFNDNGTLTVTASSITNNTAIRAGGGIEMRDATPFNSIVAATATTTLTDVTLDLSLIHI